MLRSLRLSFFSSSAKTSIFAPSCSTFAHSLGLRSCIVKDSLRRKYHGIDTPASNRLPWRREDIDALLSLQQQGKSIREIAATLQRSFGAVTDKLWIIRLRGDTAPSQVKREWTEQEINHLKSVMREVVKERDIKALVATYGRSRASIKEKLKRLRQEAGLSRGFAPFHRKVWTQQEFDRAKALCEEGKSYAEIGSILDRSEGSVRYRMTYEELTGEPFNPNYFVSDHDVEKMRLLRAQGKSPREIYQLMPEQSRIGVDHIYDITRGLDNKPARPAQSRWSPAEMNTLRDLVKKGMSPMEMVEHLPGRSMIACKSAIQRWIGPLRRAASVWSESEIEQLLQLRQEGNNMKEISAQLGRSPRACYNAFYRYNKRKSL